MTFLKLTEIQKERDFKNDSVEVDCNLIKRLPYKTCFELRNHDMHNTYTVQDNRNLKGKLLIHNRVEKRHKLFTFENFE